MKMLEIKEMVWSRAGVEIAEFVVTMVTSPIKMVLQIHGHFGDSECVPFLMGSEWVRPTKLPYGFWIGLRGRAS
jgi:hypothetical protein